MSKLNAVQVANLLTEWIFRGEGLDAEKEALLQGAVSLLEKQGCKHLGWSFARIGRCCHDCGKYMVDFGD